jgi:hypothetical protein
MLSLWALFLLSAMVISWAFDIDSRLALSGNANRVLAAEAMACSGAEIALHPSIQPSSPNLRRQMGDREGYEVRIVGEGGRLNLNWLTVGEDPARVGILRRYLELKGIDLNERNAMMDALLDWVEPNTGLHRLNAPPETDDYHPAHAPLASVDELKRVSGWGEFTSMPGWDDDFTINSSGPIDLAWASRDVLRSLPGMRDDFVASYNCDAARTASTEPPMTIHSTIWPIFRPRLVFQRNNFSRLRPWLDLKTRSSVSQAWENQATLRARCRW